LFVYISHNERYYLTVGNAETSLVEIESRDRHFKSTLRRCSMNVNKCALAHNVALAMPDKWNKIGLVRLCTTK